MSAFSKLKGSDEVAHVRSGEHKRRAHRKKLVESNAAAV
jgi:hypothetical protein